MKTKINFHKIAYTGKTKHNAVDIEIELTQRECTNFETLQRENINVLSICGNIWNGVHSDCVSCGQNLDEIKSTVIGKNPKFLKIYDLWQKYHLNDLKPGTKKQCQVIDLWRKENNINGFAYTEECEYLKSIDLYFDNAVKWGSQWMAERIPDNVISEIEQLMK
jgi:hypothetical protein